MPRRRVAKFRHFHGTTELVDVANVLNVEIAEMESIARGERPAATDRDLTGPRTLAGKLPRQPGQPITWADLRWLPVERTVRYLGSPSPHACDWRCEGAVRHSECRCTCGGRNHGIRGQAEGA